MPHLLVVLAERHERQALSETWRQSCLSDNAHLVERERVVSKHVPNRQRPGWHRPKFVTTVPTLSASMGSIRAPAVAVHKQREQCRFTLATSTARDRCSNPYPPDNQSIE